MRWLSWCWVLCCFFTGWIYANPQPTLTAKLNHYEVIEGNVVELTIETDGQVQGNPNFKSLQPTFEVLSTRRISNRMMSNGVTQFRTLWVVSLMPLETGTLTVPAFQLGNLQSQPLQLLVKGASAGTQINGQRAPLFIEASLDKESVYVQEQVVLTLRIFHSVEILDQTGLSPLDIPDARFVTLGEPAYYQEEINGIRHGVIELKFAIFPQKSGVMKIPKIAFSATTASQSRANDFFFLSRTGKAARIQSPEIEVQVKSIPNAYPANTTWLPSTQVTLTEHWMPKADTANTGETLERIIEVQAEGLLAAQLPSLTLEIPKGIKIYPKAPQTQDSSKANTVLAKAIDLASYVPTESGDLRIPPVELTWWNVKTNRLEKIKLPERLLKISNDPNAPLPLTQAPPPPAEFSQDEPIVDQDWWSYTRILLWLTALAFLLAYLFWRFKHYFSQKNMMAVKSESVEKVTIGTDMPAATNTDKPRAVEMVLAACEQNDPSAALHAVTLLAAERRVTLTQLGTKNPDMRLALEELNVIMFGQKKVTRWSGARLARAVKELNHKRSRLSPDRSALPPLYPK